MDAQAVANPVDGDAIKGQVTALVTDILAVYAFGILIESFKTRLDTDDQLALERARARYEIVTTRVPLLVTVARARRLPVAYETHGLRWSGDFPRQPG